MTMDLATMMPLLRCPSSGSALRHIGDLLLNDDGKAYPIVDGKPILVKTILPMHIKPPDQRVVSKNASDFVLGPKFVGRDIVAVHLGSGDVPSADPRVISIDLLPNVNVDLVAEAEALPLQTQSVDYVFSDAVFEHVHSPLRSIAEVRRILKDNGTFRIGTAFMQGYHGFPGHYWNMTPQAVETFLVDDFILEESVIPHPAAALHPVFHGLMFLLEKLPEKARQEYLKKSLGEFVLSLEKNAVPDIFAGRMDEYVLRSLGSNTCVEGRKPVGYDQSSAALADLLGEDTWAALKRDYYTARMAVIREHHGVGFWRMRAVEDRGCPEAAVHERERAIELVLAEGRISDTMDPKCWEEATANLNLQRDRLKNLVDSWIIEFLQRAA